MDGALTISTTWGTTDATKATIPFHLARGVKQAGIDVRIVLAGDSTELILHASVLIPFATRAFMSRY